MTDQDVQLEESTTEIITEERGITESSLKLENTEQIDIELQHCSPEIKETTESSPEFILPENAEQNEPEPGGTIKPSSDSPLIGNAEQNGIQKQNSSPEIKGTTESSPEFILPENAEQNEPEPGGTIKPSSDSPLIGNAEQNGIEMQHSTPEIKGTTESSTEFILPENAEQNDLQVEHCSTKIGEIVDSSPKTCLPENTGGNGTEGNQSANGVNTEAGSIDYTLVLLGKTGSGKSATGNTILGREAFESDMSLEHITKDCKCERANIDGKQITVIDTPDPLVDTRALKKLRNYIASSESSTFVIALVMSLTDMHTETQKRLVQWVGDNWGEDVFRHTILIFTYKDQLSKQNKTIDDYITSGSELNQLVEKCGRRYVAFNNKENDHTVQVNDLLDKVESMMQGNEGSLYTPRMFRKAQTRWKRKEMFKHMGYPAGVAVGVVATAVGAALVATIGLYCLPVVSTGVGIMATGGAFLVRKKMKSKKRGNLNSDYRL